MNIIWITLHSTSIRLTSFFLNGNLSEKFSKNLEFNRTLTSVTQLKPLKD